MVGLIKGLHNLNLHLSAAQGVWISAGLGLVASGISWILVRKIPESAAPADQVLIRDPQVFYSMAKLRKHLGRIQGATSGDIQHEAARILKDVDELEQQARDHSDLQPSTSEFASVERIFAALQIISACFMAFAHGANDVANAIGPLAGAIAILFSGDVSVSAPIPIWILALGGFGIIIGLATWGWRVIETIGKKITELTPSRGFSAEFGASTTILLASKLGLPISTTHTLVGAVLGVGLARGIGAINLSLIRDIILSWVITLPAGSLMAIVFFYILKFIFG
jgi:PiT family inorganic phosphate transporter